MESNARPQEPQRGSTPAGADAADAARQLAELEDAQGRFSRSVVVPRGYDTAGGLAAGLSVAGIPMLMRETRNDDTLVAGLTLLVLMLALLIWAVKRFKSLNGVWLSGLQGGPTGAVTAVGTAIHIALMVTAVVLSASQDWWWFGLILAPVEAAVWILVSRRWMTVYRAHAGQTSAA